MHRIPLARALVLGLALSSSALLGNSCQPTHESRGQQLYESPQVQGVALSADGSRLYAVNTEGGRVDVLNTATGAIVASVEVGIDPVSVEIKPDGSELWVSNHVSDSVSVIDLVSGSASRYSVVETVQSVDANGVTQFDEPTGIAFASNSKAYVALSSRDQIAIVDTATYQVTGTIDVNAQEPRAIRVVGSRLYVVPMESGNQSELSTCPKGAFPVSAQCTFDQADFDFATNPQLLGADVDVVIDPDVPDRDLYVYDTATDALIQVVSSVGTLLNGVAADAAGNVYVSQTEARNALAAGTAGEGLADMENRLFLNQIGTVDCTAGGATPCGSPGAIELEPLPPANPAPGNQLATPYGIAVTGDGSTLCAAAFGSSRVFTVDTASGTVSDILDVGAMPRGVALDDGAAGAPDTAYVMNSLDRTISVLDISNPAAITETAVWALTADGVPEEINRGRIAFHNAEMSTSGTFSCGSCHPDSHTDQLLWVIGAECTFSSECDQEEPRSTMPIRGLRDTLPLHWDGELADPFGGSDGQVGPGGTSPPDCTTDESCTRHLVDAALNGVMCEVGNCPTDVNELGLPGNLSEQERDDMSVFLLNVAYPPARSRRPDDQLTPSAVVGFEDFFLNQGGVNGPLPGLQDGAGPETCADAGLGGCHPSPHTAGTNSNFVGGFDAPTMRGITDRFLLFSAGVTLVEEQLIFANSASEVGWSPDVGFDELVSWAQAFGCPPGSPSGCSPNQTGFRGAYNVGAFDIFQMVEEASTGQSGAIGRQLTLNTRTAGPGERPATQSELSLLEAADDAGFVNLRGSGIRNGDAIVLSYVGGSWRNSSVSLTSTQLLDEAAAGTTLLTATALHGAGVDAGTAQPTLTVGVVDPATDPFFDGRMDLPELPGDNPMLLDSKHLASGASIIVDGEVVGGTIACVGGSFTPFCSSEQISVTLDTVPSGSGLHVIQVQNPRGLVSNEMPFLVD